MSIEDVLRAAASNGVDNDDGSNESVTFDLETLKNMHRLLNTRGTFEVGDVVVWKSGLKNKRRPEYQQPVIVEEVLAEPVIDKSDSTGSPYFREPLDLAIGMDDGDGDYVVFHVDSRRFDHYD